MKRAEVRGGPSKGLKRRDKAMQAFAGMRKGQAEEAGAVQMVSDLRRGKRTERLKAR